MEKSTQNLTNHKDNLYLKSRNNITIEGILEVISSNENEIIIKLKDTTLTISGNNIYITKLNLENEILEANGNFYGIKYGKTGNIFKRIFKWKFLIFYKWKTYV